MTYDLRSMILQTRRRRVEIRLRAVQTPASARVELSEILGEVPRFWQSEGRARLLEVYRPGGLTEDDIADDIAIVLAALAASSDALAASLVGRLLPWITRVDAVHRLRFINGIRGATGVDVAAVARPLAASAGLKTFTEEIAGLVRNLNADAKGRLSRIILEATRQQAPPTRVGREISEALGIVRRRANFIARDQANKVTGFLARERAREAGLTRYRWRHSRALNGRDLHIAREGKIFEINRPPSDGPPRTQPNCSCNEEFFVELEDLELEE